MSPDPAADPHATAITQLRHLGLSTYAAKTFVALTGLGTATAKEVSNVSDVPRTRVYDAVDELHDAGLVDVQQSSPKQFYPVSAESTGRKFHTDLQRRIDLLTDALDEIRALNSHGEQRGVWTANGRETVTDRVVEFLADADDEIVYMTVGELLDDRVVDALADAADRGVSVHVAGSSSAVEETILSAVSDGSTFESMWLWSDTPAGRLLLVDGAQTLASVLTRHKSDDVIRDSPSETAIWGVGETNSLVTVLKAMFMWRLSDGATDDDTENCDDDSNPVS